ncbi:AraC family transcriptional regulator [Paenibacillus senegalensis]|uniref:AraC family transcriptional regulator n=1 Tax=Paenibacillus senegalensis TaxID=1465766 RepID=UPI000288BFEE|nr:AraC family transcriptional regulator [Paenibacillus senegalensis]
MLQRLDCVFWRQKKQFLLAEDTYDTWVWIAVQDGSFRFSIGLAEGIGRPGDIVCCPPWVPFGRETLEPLTFHFIRLGFAGSGSPPAGFHAGLLAIKHPDRLRHNLTLLSELDDALHLHPEPIRKHLVRDILMFCLEEQGSLDAVRLLSSDPLMNEAVALIREQAADVKFNVGAAARAIGLTPVQFSRRFQAAFPLTPIRYLTECRIQLAKKLLTETDDTLEQIAGRCGYENGYYFSRVFKQAAGTTPSSYRRQFRV